MALPTRAVEQLIARHGRLDVVFEDWAEDSVHRDEPLGGPLDVFRPAALLLERGARAF